METFSISFSNKINVCEMPIYLYADDSILCTDRDDRSRMILLCNRAPLKLDLHLGGQTLLESTGRIKDLTNISVRECEKLVTLRKVAILPLKSKVTI